MGARRFRCLQASCERRIFTERFSRDIIDPYARRTSRLDALTHMIALVLGGRPGERLADRLAMPVSADTLLRLLRRRAAPTPSTVRVVGIDDFAWLKGQRYGTIVCDLERRRTIDLLPDREGATVANWLADHPGIEIVCRDRRAADIERGLTRALLGALQIADRWHLLENATAAFVEAVKRHMRHLRRAITSGDVDPDALTAAEKLQWIGWKRRDEVNGMVRGLHRQGRSIKAIVRTTGVSRQTVRRILAGTRDDVFRCRETTLDRWAETLNANWNGGCRNGSELWRRLRAAGFGGSLRVVTEWTTRRRRASRAGANRPDSITTLPSARTIARLLTSDRDCRSAEALRIRVAVETASPTIVAARNLFDRFRTMIAAKKPDDLASWIRDTADSELASFASGIQADAVAVRAAIVEPWSNGQTEGQVTRLKLVKRQMYGRGKVDLLRARMVQPREKGRQTAPKLRQSQLWTPVQGQCSMLFDILCSNSNDESQLRSEQVRSCQMRRGSPLHERDPERQQAPAYRRARDDPWQAAL